MITIIYDITIIFDTMMMQDPKDLFLHPSSDLGKDLFSTSVAELRRKVRPQNKDYITHNVKRMSPDYKILAYSVS